MAQVSPALSSERHRESIGTSVLAVDRRSIPLAGVSCLLVDDSETAVTHAAVLAGAGATVAHVRTVREGLLALARDSWKLVLAGPTLPDGSGYQVVAYAAMTTNDVAILIYSDTWDRQESGSPLERAFTFVERRHAGDGLVRCAEFALIRANRSEPPSPQSDGAPSRTRYAALGFASQYQLSSRQRQVLTLLVSGSPPKEIAQHLAVSPITIRRHAEEIYRKCGVRCQRELLVLVMHSTVTGCVK